MPSYALIFFIIENTKQFSDTKPRTLYAFMATFGAKTANFLIFVIQASSIAVEVKQIQ